MNPFYKISIEQVKLNNKKQLWSLTSLSLLMLLVVAQAVAEAYSIINLKLDSQPRSLMSLASSSPPSTISRTPQHQNPIHNDKPSFSMHSHVPETTMIIGQEGKATGRILPSSYANNALNHPNLVAQEINKQQDSSRMSSGHSLRLSPHMNLDSNVGIFDLSQSKLLMNHRDETIKTEINSKNINQLVYPQIEKWSVGGLERSNQIPYSLRESLTLELGNQMAERRFELSKKGQHTNNNSLFYNYYGAAPYFYDQCERCFPNMGLSSQQQQGSTWLNELTSYGQPFKTQPYVSYSNALPTLAQQFSLSLKNKFNKFHSSKPMNLRDSHLAQNYYSSFRYKTPISNGRMQYRAPLSQPFNCIHSSLLGNNNNNNNNNGLFVNSALSNQHSIEDSRIPQL